MGDSSMAYLLLGSKMMSTGSMEAEKPNPTRGKINMTVKGVLARKRRGLTNSEAMANALVASITSRRPQPIHLMELTGQKIRSKRPSGYQMFHQACTRCTKITQPSHQRSCQCFRCL